jgi:hypothetical protein
MKVLIGSERSRVVVEAVQRVYFLEAQVLEV